MSYRVEWKTDRHNLHMFCGVLSAPYRITINGRTADVAFMSSYHGEADYAVQYVGAHDHQRVTFNYWTGDHVPHYNDTPEAIAFTRAYIWERALEDEKWVDEFHAMQAKWAKAA